MAAPSDRVRSESVRPVPDPRALTAVVSACLLSLVALGFTKAAVRASPGADTPSFLYTVTGHYEPLAWMHGAERFGSGSSIFVHDAQGKRPLVPGFAASADPAVSFDGQRVLFAGKLKPGDPWRIFEIALAGGESRRITSGSEDCIRPL